MKKIYQSLTQTEKYFFFGAVLLILIAFGGAMKNDFIKGWDDGAYLMDNKDVSEFGLDKVFHIFSSYEQGNYHPLTETSFGLERAIFGYNSTPFHIDNLILHILNTLLVFFFLVMLTKNKTISFIVMFLFAVNTTHVESVVWISERKDVLYTFFFLLSLIFYLKFKKYPAVKKFYHWSLGLYVLSCLSKGMAVPLAGVIVLIDIFQKRKFTKELIREKIPYFVIALVFAVVAFMAQGKAVQLDVPYTALDRLRIVSYSFFLYFQKLITPLHLSGFYPYPPKPDNNLEPIFWMYPPLVFLVAVITLWSLKKTRVVFFCLAFFITTIITVLQIIPVGGAMIADRYAYVPSIGFSLLIAYGINYLIEYFKKKRLASLQYPLFAGLAFYIGWLAYLTIDYSKWWDGSIKFYSSVLNQYPTCVIMLNNRGDFLMKERDALLSERDTLLKQNLKEEAELKRIAADSSMAKAIRDLELSSSLNPNDYKPLVNLGVAMHKKEKYRAAITVFNKAIKLNDTTFDGHNNRAACYAMLGIGDSAEADWKKALQIKPEEKTARANYELFLKKKQEGTVDVRDLSFKISQHPDDPALYYQRAQELMKRSSFDSALSDLEQAIRLKKDYTDAMYSKASIYSAKNLNQQAIDEYSKLLAIDSKYVSAYMNRGIEYGRTGKLDRSLEDLKKVVTLDPNNKDGFYNLGITYHVLGKHPEACAAIKRAADLGNEMAQKAVADQSPNSPYHNCK